MGVEKRKFSRYVFPRDSDIRASLRLVTGHGTVDWKILNISEGGMGLAAERNNIQGLEEDHELFLEKVNGEQELESLKGATIKVKWILNYEPLENIGIGCEFVELNQKNQRGIRAFLYEK